MVNPLAKHFRQPAIYLKLPSSGHFYPEGTLELPVDGKIPIYPMTVKDEITLRTPDALMKGGGMIDVVKSCCPNIKDPWAMPSVDLDAVFIALRLASYGAGMDVTTSCPHCTNSNEHTVDLRGLLDNVKPVNFKDPVTIDGLKFQFKPQKYQDINKVNLLTFEEQRLVNAIILNDELGQEEKNRQFAESFDKINKMNIETVVVSIKNITTEEGDVVTDTVQITEFLESCSRKTYNDIKEAVQKLIDANKMDPINVQCENEDCLKEYPTTITFDQSNFFG
jgi:hypothetical protein